MKPLLMVSASVLFLAATGATAWIALRGEVLLADRAVTPVARKTFSTGLAEGLRFRDFDHFGVDLLVVDAVRIETLRRGGITLGAFNVLALDGVTVNLVKEQSQPHEPTFGRCCEPPISPTFDFIDRFKNAKGLTEKTFSSVRISRLAVNRLTAGETERLFTAETAEAGLVAGKALRLKGCRVFAGGADGAPVNDARVEVEPTPALVYSQRGGREERMPLQ